MRSKFVLPLLLVIAACQDGATTPSPADLVADMPADQIMYGVEHRMTSEGVRRAVLHGDTAYVHQGGSRFDLVGVRMVFFDETGRETGNLTSKTGTYELRAGSMLAEGEVVLRTQGENGERTLETEQLHFSVNGDRLWSDQPVVMREGGRIVHGTSFESDGRFQNLTVARARTEGRPLDADGEITF
jgi:LPS export ABC transporter protein LptC